jgi:hypothetical protein
MNSKRLSVSLFMSLVTLVVIAVMLILTDVFFLKGSNIGLLKILFVSLISAVLLFPFFYWIHSGLKDNTIEATRLSDLELNDRDVREAVNQWIYIHYGKKADGSMDFNLADDGSLICRVTVRDE